MCFVTHSKKNATFAAGNLKSIKMQDEEGVQSMRILGRNIAFLVKAIAAEKGKSGLRTEEQSKQSKFRKGEPRNEKDIDRLFLGQRPEKGLPAVQVGRESVDELSGQTL